jgi:multifunctional 2-oxoglutarate metabolism enzyme
VTTSTTVEVVVPHLGESVGEATVVTLFVSVGEAVEEGAPLVAVTTDKVDVEVPSPCSGNVIDLPVREGDTVAIGHLVAVLQPLGPNGASTDVGGTPEPQRVEPQTGSQPSTTPVAARIADVHAVDLSAVQGSGSGGRIGKRDLDHVISTPRPHERPLSSGEARLASYMEESRAVPTATTLREVPVGELVHRRQQLKDAGKAVSFTHLLAFAVVKAAHAVPEILHSFREDDGRPVRVLAEGVNLGLAVDVTRPDGAGSVLVPVIRCAEGRDFNGFVDQIDDLARRSRDQRVTADELTGSNITFTNTGSFGSTTGVPRLLAGQGAIVAAGAIGYPAGLRKIADRIGAEPSVWLACTYDHRVIQGADSGRLLETIEQLLDGGSDFYREIFDSIGVALPSSLPLDQDPRSADRDGRAFEVGAAARSALEHLRTVGYRTAQLDPLAEPGQNPPRMLARLEMYEAELRRIPAQTLEPHLSGYDDVFAALAGLERAYCGTTGYEYQHLSSADQRAWWREQIEAQPQARLSAADTRRILSRLLEIDRFERFLQTTWVGQKTLSIQGLDMSVLVVEDLVRRSALDKQSDVVIGMAHRGRLAILCQVVGMSYDDLFREFEAYTHHGVVRPRGNTGDVKQHLGGDGSYRLESGEAIAVHLAANPSHLEFVSPVALGIARGLSADTDRSANVVPILLHGDGSFTAQGVVGETFNLSGLSGYSVGGAIHVIQNNQIAFTTGPAEGRSSRFVTDFVRGADVPVLHVNGEDVDACLAASRLAYEYRRQFGRDVIIDVVGYRRHGHTEADEPVFTHPALYEQIRARPVLADAYAEELIERGTVSREEITSWERRYTGRLREAHDAATAPHALSVDALTTSIDVRAMPRVSLSRLREVNACLARIPAEIDPHPKLRSLLERRLLALADTDETTIDWAHAELLALGTLLAEDKRVRLSGQDTQRGAFSQRHLLLHDRNGVTHYTPLHSVALRPGAIEIINSPLSEQAPLGFEWGFSTVSPATLVLWEAQFGDFANGAQVIIDQFISAAHDKWGIDSALTLLLPHGFEGAGPEHSSARLERFLALAVDGGLRVAYPSTASQYFHLLRRQAYLEPRQPLAVMTPKSLLRAPAATASAQELTSGRFLPLMLGKPLPPGARRLVLATGKITHELEREIGGDQRIGVVRIEELAPFPSSDLRAALEGLDGLTEIAWAQEEPRNMGAWNYVAPRIQGLLPPRVTLGFVGRSERASPAEGYPPDHAAEQTRIIRTASDPTTRMDFELPNR